MPKWITRGQTRHNFTVKVYIAKGLQRKNRSIIIGSEHVNREKKNIRYLAWDIEDPLSAKLVWSKVLLCKTCCNMAKIAHVVNQIRFFQPLPNPMNHKYQMSYRHLQTIRNWYQAKVRVGTAVQYDQIQFLEIDKIKSFKFQYKLMETRREHEATRVYKQ